MKQKNCKWVISVLVLVFLSNMIVSARMINSKNDIIKNQQETIVDLTVEHLGTPKEQQLLKEANAQYFNLFIAQ